MELAPLKNFSRLKLLVDSPGAIPGCLVSAPGINRAGSGPECDSKVKDRKQILNLISNSRKETVQLT